jgi:hypothetical protein
MDEMTRWSPSGRASMKDLSILTLSNGNFRQVGERGISNAKIVERDRDAELLQLAQGIEISVRCPPTRHALVPGKFRTASGTGSGRK